MNKLKWIGVGSVIILLAAILMFGCSTVPKAASTPKATSQAPQSTSPTAALTTAPTAPATAKPQSSVAPTSAFTSFGAGKKSVGTDIKPGTYRTRQASPGCYWSRLSGFGGTMPEILANENTDGPAVVTIAGTDKGFDSARCGTWSADLSRVTAGTEGPLPGDGTFIVGADLAPGTWRSAAKAGCYWARLAGFSGDMSEIIANGNDDAGAIVNIPATDKGFITARCGQWTRAQ